MSCTLKLKTGLSQYGGCGEKLMQYGGKFGKGQENEKAKEWIREVRDIRDKYNAEHPDDPMTYKNALVQASAERKAKDKNYKTTKDKYAEKHPNDAYGKKNKRPLTLKAAERVLLQYYRDRAEEGQFVGNPIDAMRKDIAKCVNKDKILKPCSTDKEGKMIIDKNGVPLPYGCAKNWKYRYNKGRARPGTGPGYYDMEGVDNFCDSNEGSKTPVSESRLYNKRTIDVKRRPKK